MLILIVVSGLAATASAIEVKIDFGGDAMAGYTGWNEPWNSNITVDGAQLSMDQAGHPGGPKIRTGTGDDLMHDALSSEDEGGGGTYTLHITNLAAGAYTLVSYHNNPTTYGPTWSDATTVTSTVSGGDSDSTVAAHNAADLGVLTDAVGLNTVTFSSTGASDVIDVTWSHSGGATPWTNGFILIPEPATVALLSLGSLVLLRKRRHA